MPRIPPIKNVMRAFPYSLQADRSLEEARKLMAEHEIRHLPVLDGDELVGIVTSHDLDHFRPIGRRPTTVREITTAPAYTVPLDEPLDNVLLHMATQRLGSALVERNGRVVGIYTTTDALHGFADHLRRDFPADGDDAA